MYQLRIYTLRTADTLELYATTHWPRHISSLLSFGVTTHGFWTDHDPDAHRLFALISFPSGANPDEVTTAYMNSPAFRADMAGFDVTDITDVEEIFLDLAAASPQAEPAPQTPTRENDPPLGDVVVHANVPAFHVQTTATVQRDGFPYFAHHDSVSALWATKWRPLCAAGIYPFTDADVADFDPVFDTLINVAGDSSAILHRPDEYAAHFMPAGRRLVEQAEQAQRLDDRERARDLFLRAAAVFRIARFPINRSPVSHQAWDSGKSAYEQGALLLDPPSVAVSVPFRHADLSAGDRDAAIQAYLRVPAGPLPERGWPVLLFICGLDAYRTDHTPRTQAHVDRGFATLSFEIPGTGDCPAAPADPDSPDRLMSSIIDWVLVNATQHGFDVNRIVARGISTGGYYAFRIAHTHAQSLLAVVAQGGGCHHMFDPGWISAQNQMEYPFALADALAYKFGYDQADPADAIARYTAEARRFSLLDTGVLATPTCRLLAINGMEDSIFPIEDTILAATDGVDKDLLIRGNRGHMGNPGAEDLLYDWIDNVTSDRP